MRKSFNSISQCAHVWAQNSQAEGYSGNISFCDGTIYSYRYWPMATFVKNARGEEAVLIRNERYSNSTSRHQREAYSALPSYVRKIVLYGDLYNDVNTWVPDETMRRRVQDMIMVKLGKAKRARKYTVYHLQDARTYAEAFNELLGFFGDTTVEPITWDEDTDTMLQKLEEQAAAQQEREEKEALERVRRMEERRKQQEVTVRADLHLWLQGERISNTYRFSYLPCALRIVDDRIETSHGAEVPLSYARRLWALIGNCRHNNTTYHPENFEVGHFRLREVAADGTLSIGCHTIPYSATREIARQLGYISEAEYTAEVERENMAQEAA